MAEDFPRVHADASTVALTHIGERNQLHGKESAKGKHVKKICDPV